MLKFNPTIEKICYREFDYIADELEIKKARLKRARSENGRKKIQDEIDRLNRQMKFHEEKLAINTKEKEALVRFCETPDVNIYFTYYLYLDCEGRYAGDRIYMKCKNLDEAFETFREKKNFHGGYMGGEFIVATKDDVIEKFKEAERQMEVLKATMEVLKAKMAL